MKKFHLASGIVLLLSIFTLSSCQAIADIFKAGMGFGIFIAIAVIAVILFVIFKVTRGKDS